LLSWSPLDNSHRAEGVAGTSSAYEAANNGDIGKFYTRAQFRTHAEGKSRTAWLAVDPISLPSDEGSQEFYRKVALSSVLVWASGAPVARVSTWKGGAASAAVISVDAEDQFKNSARFANSLKSARFPSTFFSVSNLFQTYPELVIEAGKDIEFASHSENHKPFRDQDMELQFERIQASRLEIESITEKRVAGFRPPEEKYDEATIQAVIQNRIEFFFGDQKFFRFTPLWVGTHDLLFVPRTASDDYALCYLKGLRSNSEIAQAALAEFKKTHRLNGGYFFNAHTQIFGLPKFHDAFVRLLAGINDEKGVWKTSFSSLRHWWQDRTALEVRLSSGLELGVTNTSARAIEGAVIEIDSGVGVELKPSAGYALDQDETGYRLTLP
jgi:peptidoglycan/xylan/chitin deacetylase (PgdA/CDA1 family)